MQGEGGFYGAPDGNPDRPAADLTKRIAAAAAAGVLLLTCGVRDNAIRFRQPLTIEPDLLAEALVVIGGIIRGQAVFRVRTAKESVAGIL